MKLSSRFLLDSLFMVAGAFLAVVSLAWAAGPAGWTAFGVFTGATVLAAVSAALTARGSRRVGHGLLGVVALWSLIAALVFSGTALTWLVLAHALRGGVPRAPPARPTRPRRGGPSTSSRCAPRRLTAGSPPERGAR